MKRKHFFVDFLIFSGLIFFGFTSCASTPKEISSDLTFPEIIQSGQTAFDSGKRKVALLYFSVAVERFGDSIANYVEARYETAHIFMRQKKYEKAEPILREISEIYKNSTPGSIPAAYQKLAEIELKKIPEKNSKNGKNRNK